MTGNGAGGRGEGRLPALPFLPPTPRGHAGADAGVYPSAGWRGGGGWGGVGWPWCPPCPPARPFPGANFWPGGAGLRGQRGVDGKSVPPSPLPPRSRAELGGDGEGPGFGGPGGEMGARNYPPGPGPRNPY